MEIKIPSQSKTLMKSKKDLELILSKLKNIESPKINLEQFQTPSDIAAEVLWFAYMNNDIKNKIVADLGCGNGILGIGSSFLGAKKIIFLDSDRSSLFIAKNNFENLNLKNAVFLDKNISEFNEKVDAVIQNPPFGVQNEHADKEFLIAAMKFSKKIYSFHKLESEKFIIALAKDYSFKLKGILKFNFPIKKTQQFHSKENYIVKVGCFILNRNI